MNHDFYILDINNWVSSTVETGLEYNIKKQTFEDFFYNQKIDEVFISQPCPIFPFSETVFIARSHYDLAKTISRINIFHISVKMREILANLNMPQYQTWPIKYKMRGQVYDAYWLAFTRDSGLDTDFSKSVFQIKHYDDEKYEFITFKDMAEYKSMNNNRSKLKIEELLPYDIRLIDSAYELDIIPLFHFHPPFIVVSKKVKNLMEVNKFKNIEFHKIMPYATYSIDGLHFKYHKYV